ncbi:hypothetical protein ACFP9V_19215 [Deinococcus radiopugnans]|uniref:Uncharacterized protein n=1 Tax=Deinococcus radiopugnans ATCC 19172 TaxID=585398 RepID=A0A5C4Y7P7_9DEIO|nr:hypothetical protein [Deinococcus radiopugnans]MBB6016836.1 hypothetical protein [Deinococcus radiopugnans ATCC 19172]TNM71877.1 hypothetical protein FHR04_05785 [Deinococcus radiopugnans ATCC 19172]
MNPTTRATTRTWAAHTTYRECGVVTGISAHVVTITRTGTGFEATIDGRTASVLDADRVLRAADRLEVTAEVLEAAPTIGKAVACALHRELGALGYKAHYALASEALEREIVSLAALSADDATTVRSYAYGQLGLAA